MMCKPHGMMNDNGTCPYCRIAELEAENANLREAAQAVVDDYGINMRYQIGSVRDLAALLEVEVEK